MVAKRMHATAAPRTNVARRVAVKVAGALKGETLVEPGAIEISARIAGTAIAVVASLTEEARRKLNSREAELISRMRGLLESFSTDASGTKIQVDQPQEVEKHKGDGLGEILSDEDGRQALNAYAVAKRLEDWAGPVAGATELSREYGVARSSLNRWQHTGDIIGLLKGTHKHVYPIDQFVDSRPARGIAEVNAVVSNPRVAWLWLSRGNPTLGGQRPIDLLKHDRVAEVVEAAQAYFQQ